MHRHGTITEEEEEEEEEDEEDEDEDEDEEEEDEEEEDEEEEDEDEDEEKDEEIIENRHNHYCGSNRDVPITIITNQPRQENHGETKTERVDKKKCDTHRNVSDGGAEEFDFCLFCHLVSLKSDANMLT